MVWGGDWMNGKKALFNMEAVEIEVLSFICKSHSPFFFCELRYTAYVGNIWSLIEPHNVNDLVFLAAQISLLTILMSIWDLTSH